MDDQDQTQEGALDTAGEAMGYEFPDEFLPDTSGLAEQELGNVPYARREYEAEKGKTETAFQEVLKQINAAKQRLLAQPTELTRQQYLQGLASKLTTPPERTDPRFYERRNLYTFLRDVGQYGAEQEAAQKAAKIKQAEEVGKLDQLIAKYGFETAQKREAQAATLLGRAREAAAVKKPTSEFERLIADMSPEEQARMRRMRAIALATESGGKDKGELSPADLRSIGLAVNDALSKPKERLDEANTGLQQIQLAKSGNPKAEAQVDRALAALVGDKALSLSEVQAVSGAGSFPQRVVDSLTRFLSGGSSKLSLDEKQQLLEAYENYHAAKYQREQARMKSVYSGPGFENVPAAIFGSPYISIRQKREAAEAEAARKRSETPTAEPAAPSAAPAETTAPATHTTKKGNLVRKISG